nr:intersectin 2 [Hymenolepis microstoma]
MPTETKMMNDWNNWKITIEDRLKHDDRFQVLRPLNGFITGEQARNFFTQSKLPNHVLAKIWSLADLNSDGQLDRREFSIAMYLIKKCLEGNTLPLQLPPTLLLEPQHQILSLSLDPLSPPSSLKSNSDNRAEKSDNSSDWSISSALRPKYKLQFNQNDRNKRGYLTGVEARGIFLKSNLPQPQLAAIWNLADVDKDGNLTCEEFCIAAYLIDQVLAGRKLPAALPSTLMPSSLTLQTDRLKSHPSDGNEKVDFEDRITFEDKRMQNFLLGQVELDKRKQDLAEQLRQEEEQRREEARIELEKREKFRQEKERERQRQLEAEAEKARVIEARRQDSATARLNSQREELRRLAAETEASRVAALVRELAQETAALDNARAQVAKRATLAQRLAQAQAEVNAKKAVITGLAGERGVVERECKDLAERLEAAKAELNRWQREQDQIQRQLAPPPSVVVDITNTTEQQKTLRSNLKQVQESKRQLEAQLSELETEVLRGGQRLASHRHTAEELAKKRSLLATEVNALLATLLERRHTFHRQKQQHFKEDQQQQNLFDTAAATKQNDIDAVNTITSTALDAGPSEMYRALYAYTATRSDELTFVERDKIQIFINPPFEVCEGWLYGEMGGKRGLVPACYVKKSSPEDEMTQPAATVDPFALPTSSAISSTANSTSINPFPPNQSNSLPLGDDISATFSGEKPLFTCIALYNYETNIPGDLSLQVNDKVEVFVDNNGWYEGVSQRTRQRGLFPANHVQKLQSDIETTNMSSSTGQVSAFPVAVSLEKSTSKSTSSPPLQPTSTPPPALAQGKKEEKAHKETDGSKAGDQTETDSAVITVCENPELAVVITPFTARSCDQLSLTVGQYVKIRAKSSKGWWEGETQQRGQDRRIGWFPADCARLVSANNSTENQPAAGSKETSEESAIVIKESIGEHIESLTPRTSEPSTSAEAKTEESQTSAATGAENSSSTVASSDLASAAVVQSMFAYKACQPDEMTFPEGALIVVLAHEEEGWWRGRINSTGVEGLFPVNYVKPYHATSESSAPHSTTPTLKPSVRHSVDFYDLAPVHKFLQFAARGGSFSHSESQVIQASQSTKFNTILELIDSEKHYLTDLIEVKEKFYEGLRRQGVSELRLAQIFCNWTSICEVSEAINKDFQERKPNLKKGEDLIGDILVRHLPKCMVYRDFCANQDAALENLKKLSEEKKEVAQFLLSCERFMRVQSMPLSSYFLKPMQRITKYKLIIEKLVNHTPPDHPDYENLEQSLELVSTVLSVCNEAIKNQESFGQIYWLRDHLIFDSDTGGFGVCGEDDRRLIDMEVEVGGERRRRLLLYSGTLYKVNSKKELIAFLFTDMLLLAQPVNISASSLPSGNLMLPQKPDATLAKVNFKTYRRGIFLSQIRVSTAASLSPKSQRKRSVFRASRGSVADISTLASGGSGGSSAGGGSRDVLRSRRRSLANLRKVSLSVTNLSDFDLDSSTFLITDDSDPSVHFLLRAPSSELRTSWIEFIQKASAEYRQYLDLFRNPFLSSMVRESLFAAVLNLTVVSASGLPMMGPSEDELPWPYCEVSLCLRCKRTNVILSTRSPKWNCSLRFTVKDLTRDVVTINVYSKSASSSSELIGKTEIEMPEIVEHCQGDRTWHTVLPLALTSPNPRSSSASITLKFALTENVAMFAGEDLE